MRARTGGRGEPGGAAARQHGGQRAEAPAGRPAGTSAEIAAGAAAGAARASVSAPASTAALKKADAAEVLGGCLHAWAVDLLRGLRLHEENAGSPSTAPAAAGAVRRIRAAARRIGSALHTYRPLVDAAWADGLSAELRSLSGTLALEYRLGARQDRLLAALHRLAVEGAGGARAAALLERQHTPARSRARSAALEAMASSRFHALADAVAVLAYEVPLASGAPQGPAGAVLVPLAERARDRLAGAVGALSTRSPAPLPHARHGRDAQAGRDAAWLEARILLRHHRYAQEVLCAAATPPGSRGTDGSETSGRDGAVPGEGGSGGGRGGGGAGGGLRPTAGASAQLAEASAALDRVRDAVEAADAAAAAARTPRIAPSTAYALGVLHAVQREDAEYARRDFHEAWEEAGEKAWKGALLEGADRAGRAEPEPVTR